MTVRFGYELVPAEFILNTNGDFNCTVTNPDGPWPASSSLELRFDNGVIWVATRAGAVFTFSVDKAVVNTQIAARPRTATIFYIDPPADLPWYTGPVIRK